MIRWTKPPAFIDAYVAMPPEVPQLAAFSTVVHCDGVTVTGPLIDGRESLVVRTGRIEVRQVMSPFWKEAWWRPLYGEDVECTQIRTLDPTYLDGVLIGTGPRRRRGIIHPQNQR